MLLFCMGLLKFVQNKNCELSTSGWLNHFIGVAHSFREIGKLYSKLLQVFFLVFCQFFFSLREKSWKKLPLQKKFEPLVKMQFSFSLKLKWSYISNANFFTLHFQLAFRFIRRIAMCFLQIKRFWWEKYWNQLCTILMAPRGGNEQIFFLLNIFFHAFRTQKIANEHEHFVRKMENEKFVFVICSISTSDGHQWPYFGQSWWINEIHN